MTLSIITPIDQADIMNRTTTTHLARVPIWFHRDRGSHPTVVTSCSNRNAQTCNCKIIVLFSPEILIGQAFTPCPFHTRTRTCFCLLAQREVHVDLRCYFHRLSVEKSRFVHPLFYS